MYKQMEVRIIVLFIFLTGLSSPGFAYENNPVTASEVPHAFDYAFKDAENNYLNEKINLDYKDADISSILRSLSYSYNLNLVTSTEIKGKVTIALKDITIADALDAILSANGYDYSVKRNIIYITPGISEGSQLISVPIVLKYLKAVDSQSFLRKSLSPKGDIKVHEISNTLIITDYYANIDKIKELLRVIDHPPQQVLIEAKIVDITSKDLNNLGITWQVDYDPGRGIFKRNTATSESLDVTSTIAGPSSTLSGGQFRIDTLVLKALSASATIDALVQDQKAHLLASPSIAVLNNREARIVIGEKVPYKERTQTTTGTTETTKFIDVGTTLRVTPSINDDGYITLDIHPEVSSVSALLDAGPRITTREADTIVRIKEGETVVIGGLIKQEDNQTRSRVPLLGYIPIIGSIFGNRSKDQTQIELAVFITPKILRSYEEMIAFGENRYQEESCVNILASGRLNAQMKLFENARNLQVGSGLESRRKEDWQRKRQALAIYENISTQFSDSPKAAEASYQAALIYYYDLSELYFARDLCAKVISDYPRSPFAVKAKDLHKIISDSLSKQAEVELKLKARTKAREEKARLKREKKEQKVRLSREREAELVRIEKERGIARQHQALMRETEKQEREEKKARLAREKVAKNQAREQAREQEKAYQAREREARKQNRKIESEAKKQESEAKKQEREVEKARQEGERKLERERQLKEREEKQERLTRESEAKK
ncbi:MAG: hypothetical protein KKF54_02215, partial [Candidatus Omnitrophica bacterium]|nr:hypothetical protein [Candidatus Omnitrophota bacterium]